MKRAFSALLVFCSVLALSSATGGVAQAAYGDACYQVHVADYGWQPWQCGSRPAGSTGENKAIEAVRIQIKNGGTFCAAAHIRNVGWQPEGGLWCVGSGQTVEVGTVGRGLPLEAVMVQVSSKELAGQAHVQNVGWMDAVYGSRIIIGTTGRGLNLEAMTLTLRG
ncbi:hypothetical protein ACFWBN_37480 [Streptomyces sp. NPDC059989]|uniref:hypothetical protein n=1 Tax=Streptomyces sp. NPDC059989 TaxID=3347026 RepID=UPI0036B7601D